MGLSCSHNAWIGSYGSFNLWRSGVAKAARLPYPVPMLVLKAGTNENPIMHLLKHSDCDGQISPSRCAKIADALDQLTFNDQLMTEKTRIFVRGLRAAAEERKPLLFR